MGGEIFSAHVCSLGDGMKNRKNNVISLRGVRKKRKAQKENSNRPYLRRILLACVVISLMFVVLCGRLFWVMIVQHDYYEKAAIDNQTRSTSVGADRGTIYDCNMNVLANSVTVENVFLDPQYISENNEDLDLIASGLSRLLDLDEDYIKEEAADTRLQYKVIKRKISQDLADEVRAFLDENGIIGVHLETDSKRTYPNTTLAAQVVGFTNAENKGAEGLEAGYDDMLTGNAGAVVMTRGNYGTEMLYSYEKYYEASDGNDLVLTIDNNVQYYLEKNMRAAIEKYDVLNGAFGIVMDVNTGEIKAMSTLGTYDPNNYLEIGDTAVQEKLDELYEEAAEAKRLSGLSEAQLSEELEHIEVPAELDEDAPAPTTQAEYAARYKLLLDKYNSEVASARLKQWRNRVVSDGYEPGSTFKTITLASALEEGAISLDDTWFCGGAAKIERRDDILHCWKEEGHGSQNTAQALQNSCNIAFANIGIKLGGERLYDYVEAFGLLERTGIDLPGEATGYFFSKDSLSDTRTYASLTSAAFGQTFKVTPIQLVRAISAVVNGGYVLEPYVVSEVLDENGNVTRKNERHVLRQVISEETSATMCRLMESVVTEGTASNAQVVGYSIGGKTGTSEKIDERDKYGNMVEDKIVSFVGVAPIDDPQYVVLVALDTPSPATGYYISGGVMAAPAVRDVFTDILPYLGVTPHYSEDELEYVNMTMPNVVALSLEEAEAALKENHLEVRVIGEGTTVTDQIPSPGGEVPGNSTVLIYLGEEKPTDLVTVPSLIGLTQYEAMITIQNTGGLYMQIRGSNSQSGAVAVSAQSVEAGTQVERGTTVTVELTDSSARD